MNMQKKNKTIHLGGILSNRQFPYGRNNYWWTSAYKQRKLIKLLKELMWVVNIDLPANIVDGMRHRCTGCRIFDSK